MIDMIPHSSTDYQNKHFAFANEFLKGKKEMAISFLHHVDPYLFSEHKYHFCCAQTNS